jgi:pyridoxine kinase
MRRILAISSQVAHGTVGLSVIVPTLQALGHQCIALPTVVLSNHPGHPHVAGTRIAAATLAEMLAALEANGWLSGVDCILSGYLPGVEHAAVVAELVGRLREREPGLPYICDPVIGDDPKGVYIDPAAAAAIRDRLLPLADVLTPNRFELAWLSGLPVATSAEAVTAARALGRPLVIATSTPEATGDILANLAVTRRDVTTVRVAKRARVAHGTGDMLSALVAGFALYFGGGTGDFAGALEPAVRALDDVVTASEGCADLQLGRLRNFGGER